MKKKSYLTRAVLAMVASGMLYANVGFAAKTVTTDTTLTPTGTSSFLDADKLINVKDATLTLNNDEGSSWAIDFSTVQESTATTSALNFVGNGFGIYQQGVELNTSTIQFANSYADIYVGSIGGNVQTIEINSTGQTKVYNVADYTLNANVTGTNTLSIESENGKSITLGSGKTISTAIDIMKDVYVGTGELQGQGSLIVNASQFTGTADIKNAGILTLTGGTLSRNVVAGTVRNINSQTGDVESTTTGKGEVYVTAPLTIAAGVSVTANIYGAKGSGSTAIDGKSVSITGGTISGSTVGWGRIVGGYSENGDTSNNTVTVGNGTDKTETKYKVWVMGGASISGKNVKDAGASVGVVSNNKVVINKDVVFNVADAEDITARCVHIVGGRSDNGNITGNSVEITGAKINSSNGDGNYNNIWGGYSEGSGNVSANSVTITNADIAGHKLAGGYSGSGEVSGNKFIVDGGILSATTGGNLKIYGGVTVGGNVTNNSIEFKSGTVTAPSKSDTHIENNIYGGLAEGKGNVTENSVTVSGGTFTRTSVIGGKSLGTGDVTGNSVVITGGTFTGGEHNGIGGGTIENEFDATTTKSVAVGSANNNTIKITGGVFNGMNGEYMNVGGGLVELSNFDKDDQTQVAKLKQYYTFGDASHNTVEINTNSNVALETVGGGSTPSGNADYNIVKLTGVNITVNNDVIGGCDELCFDGDVEGLTLNANYNEVYLTGITVRDSIKGGVARYGGTATHNKIVIDGGNYGYAEGSTNITGGGCEDGIGNNTVSSNNEVSISNATVYGAVWGGVADNGGSAIENNVVVTNTSFTPNVSENDNFGNYMGAGGVGSDFDVSTTAAVNLGSANGNSIKLTNVTIGSQSDVFYNVYGGAVMLDGFDDNNDDHIAVLKKYYKSGDASNNTVEVVSSKAVVLEDVFGGLTLSGKADENTIILTNTGTTANFVVNGRIEGGTDKYYRDSGITASASYNVVRLTNITTTDDINGGQGTGNGAEVSYNEVYLTGGTYKATNHHLDDSLVGGCVNGNGVANNNKVEVVDATVGMTTIGGASEGAGANSNIVTFKNSTFNAVNGDGDFYGILGGGILNKFDVMVTSKVEIGSANNNKVTMTDVTVNGDGKETPSYADVYGGYVGLEGYTESDMTHRAVLEQYYTAGGASNNEVEITSTKSVELGRVIGGATIQGNANNNIVTLSGKGIVVMDSVLGGDDLVDKSDVDVSANNNVVTLEKITVHKNVLGGEGNGKGTASYNRVYIEGGSYTNAYGTISSKRDADITGGRAGGDVIGNIVSIKDAVVAVSVIRGGKSDDGNIKDNQVIIDGVTFDAAVGEHAVAETIISGGQWDKEEFQGKPEGKVRENNSLTIGSKGFKINTDKLVTIQNFDSMTFADGATVTNNGTLTFTNNGVKDAGEGDVEVIWSAKIAGTGKLVVNYGDFTVDNVVSNAGGIEINEGGKFRVKNAGDIQTSVVNNNNMNLYSGTLTQTVDNTNGTIKIHGVVGITEKVTGGVIEIKEDGSTLRLDNGVADKLVINELVAYNYYGDEKPSYKDTVNKISFDAGFTSVVDQVQANTYKGTITLGAVGLKEEFEGEVGSTRTYQLFAGVGGNAADFTNFAINGSAEAVMGTYKYVFSDNGSNDGKLRVYKDWGYSLHDIINNSDEGHKAGTVTSYSLNGDKTETEGLGTLTRTDSTKARELTINGNSYKLIAPTGITVNAGDTLTLKDVKYSVTSGNAISGAGTTNISGTVEVGGYVENKLAIAESSTLTIAAANLGNTVVNKGVLALTGDGTLSKDITGSGTITNDGTLNIGSVLNIGGNDIIGNKVVVKNANILGSKSYDDQGIFGKNVNVSDSSMRYVSVFGATATGNTINVGSNVTVGALEDVEYEDEIRCSVFGSPLNREGTAEVSGNTVNINGENITIYGNVHGGHSEALAPIKNNKVVISGTNILVGEVDGGSCDGHDYGTSPVEVSGNSVEITGAMVGTVEGGASSGGVVKNNSVKMTNATVFADVNRETGAVDTSITTDKALVAGANVRHPFAALNNTVELNNVTSYGAVAAAMAGEGGDEGLKGNSLTINGGSYQGIYGGTWKKYLDPVPVNITENKVTVNDATVAGSIIAGRTHGYGGAPVEKEEDIVVGNYGAENGNIKDNTVTLNGVTFQGDGTKKSVELSGGYTMNLDAVISGNTLNIGAKGVTVAPDRILSVKNFDTITPATGAVLTNNGVLNIDGADANGQWNVKVAGSGTTNFNVNTDLMSRVETPVAVIETAELTTPASNLTNNVTNKGTLNLETGTLAKDLTGNGTLNINGQVNANGKTEASKINLTGNTSVLNVPKANVLSDGFNVIAGMGDKIVGTAGELGLRMGGIEYTTSDYVKVKGDLFTTGENAKLSFLDATLKLDEEKEQMTTGGTVTVTDGNTTISGAEATVIRKADGTVIAAVGAQADKTVTVTETKESVTTLIKADTITLDSNGNLSAKDLQVQSLYSKDVLTLTVGATEDETMLTVKGSDGKIVKDASGNAVPTSVTVNHGSIFTLGDEAGTTHNVVMTINELNVAGKVNIYNICLNIGKLIMNGGKIVFDPNYYGITSADLTRGGEVDVVTDGTVVAMGMSAKDVKTALDSAGVATTATANEGYTVADGSGVLALGFAVDLTVASDLQIVVDEKDTITDKAFQMGKGSILIAAKQAAASEAPAVKVNENDISVDSTAKLVISADKYLNDKGEFVNFTVLGDGTKVFDGVWTPGNVYAADPTYTFDIIDGKLVTVWNKVDRIFGENAIAAPDMYNRILQKAQGTDANAFLKKVITETAGAGSTAATKAVGANALNAATSMGELAAVQHGAVSMANQIGDTLSENLGLAARPITDGKYDKKVWASYVNNKETVEDLALAKVNADYTAKYSGVSVGADLWSSEKAVGGLAITYSKGDVNGHNGGVTTNNDAKYYGVSVYNRINVGNDSALLYDFDYLNTKNEISQHNFGTNITADAKVDVLSAGVRYEKGITTGKSVLAPFVGLRYLHLNNKEYTNSLNMHFSADKQNVFQPSVGLNWHGEFQAPNSVWTYRPYIETGYVWNMGNRDCNQVVSFDGAPNTLAYDVVDSGSYFAKVGMNFERKNFGFGFGYKYQKGSTAKISRWNVDLNWKF